MKKWLYSVGLGALLVATPSVGITVQEVLSNGFFSVEENRETLEALKSDGHYIERWKDKKPKDGMSRSLETIKPVHSTKKWKWKGLWTFKTEEEVDCSYRLIYKQKHHKDKTIGKQHKKEGEIARANYVSNRLSDEDYTGKPKGRGQRPLGPYVVYDWFSDELYSNEWQNAQFYGTEETAITNVISDNEAYITRTIRQSGWIQEYMGDVVEEPSSLLRVYNMHITTDADHVYIHQDINETSQNAFADNNQNNYTTDYTATFKGGRYKNEKETIKKDEHSQTASWYIRIYGDGNTETNSVTATKAGCIKTTLVSKANKLKYVNQ